MLLAQAFPRITPQASPPVDVTPDNTMIQVSDYAGTVTRNVNELYVTRAIDSSAQGDTSNYKRATPGLLYRFAVVSSGVGLVTIHLNYTGEIARNEPYNPYCAVYLDGNYVGKIAGPAGKAAGDGLAHPSGIIPFSLVVPNGSHLVEVMSGAYASNKLKKLTLAANVALAAPAARPTQACTFLGDSLVHGSDPDYFWNFWTTLLCKTKGWRQQNLGYGGGRIVPDWFEIAGQQSGQRCIADPSINDVLGGDPPSTIQSSYAAGITKFRAGATSIGAPTKRLYVTTSYYTENSGIPGANLSAKLATVEAARQAIRNAVSASGDPYVTLIEGAQGGFPTSLSMLVSDKLHWNTAAGPVVAAAYAGQVS